MPSFDVVSQLDEAEVVNAINQTVKEVSTRYDFRNTGSEVEQTGDEEVTLRSSSKEHLNTIYKILVEKFVRRGLSVQSLDPQEIEPATKNTVRQKILLKQGIPVEKAKTINKKIKEAKLKVVSQYQDEQVRVTGKNRDDLQTCIRFLRSLQTELEMDLQFVNMRD